MAPTPQLSEASLGVTSMAVCAVVIALAVISVGLRFYTRIITRLGLWWDDWLILAAVLTVILTSGSILLENKIDPNGDWVSTASGSGYVYTPEDTLYMKLSYACSILYFTIAGATKLGILLMYIRIFYISDGFRTQVIVASSIVLTYWIGCTIATLLTCRPMSYIWNSVSGFPTYCFDYNIFWMSAGICELLLDVMILALPIRAVTNIKLSPRRRLTVLGIFLLGGFVIITGIVKIILAFNPSGHSPLYGAADVWVTLHAGLAIVCACLPILKPLITRRKSALTKSSTTVHDRNGTSEPDGWNIIYLSDGKSSWDSNLNSPVPENHIGMKA